MKILIKNGKIFNEECKFIENDILIENEKISVIGQNILIDNVDKIIDAQNCIITPGFIDPHVHLREPGFEYKETIKSGTHAAAKGGYTTIVAMPNLNPAPNSIENFEIIQNLITKNSLINVIQSACLTNQDDKVINFNEFKKFTNIFTNDGKCVTDDELMKQILQLAAKENVWVVNHCEDELIMGNGVIKHCNFQQENNLGVWTNDVESKIFERDVQLNKIYNAKYAGCHISTPKSVETLATNKNIANADVCVNHLILSTNDIANSNFKMNPPLVTPSERDILIDALNNNLFYAIITDHAPHAEHEKNDNFQTDAFGISSIEYAFALLYTKLVKTKKVKLETILNHMTYKPAKFYNLECNLIEDALADLTIINLNEKDIIKKDNLVSQGLNNPYIGETLDAKIKYTIYKGNIIYEN